MTQHRVVSRDEWLEARRAHLAQEKEFTRIRDSISKQRRELPWVKVDKDYVFDTPTGKRSLAELFAGRSQLIVQHFMYGPDWTDGCPSCSFWVDNFDGVIAHLNARDISFVVVSRAPLATLTAYKGRMGWDVDWVSSQSNDFNWDYHVSFTDEEVAKGEMFYNFGKNKFPSSEGPGLSVFIKDEDGNIYHTYSTFSRGLDMLNGAYHLMDMVPKGRDEDRLPHSMAWLRRHDEY